METQFVKKAHITANNYKFTYLEAGEGPLVLLLHGFPDNPYTFQMQLEALTKAGYRAIAPYKRALPPGDTKLSTIQHSTLYTQDVLALIDAFEAEKVILIGHDAKLAGIANIIKFSYKKGNKNIVFTKQKFAWITSHTARRSFCTNELLAGTPVYLIMKISGHKREKDFYKYIRISPEEAAEKIKKIWMEREKVKKSVPQKGMEQKRAG